MMDKPFFNILLLSVSFMLVYTTIGTENYTRKVMMTSINHQYPNVHWNAFISLCIIYNVFSLSNFLVPPILTLISTRTCLFLSAFVHLLSYLVFFYPFKFGLNLSSITIGFAGACLWSSQGKCLIDNSDPSTIDRNVSIFWAVYEFGLVIGSLYFFLQFQGVEEVKEKDRIMTYTVLLLIGLLGTFLFLFLKKTKKDEITDLSPKSNAMDALRRCFGMFKTKTLLLLIVTTFYTGLEQAFFNSIYPSAIAFTKSFGADSVKLIGLYGICNGLGQITGALLFGWLGKKLFKNISRTKIFIIGSFIHITTFVLISLNHPKESTIGETYNFGVIEPEIWIALMNGFSLGLGDAIFSTQLIAMIGLIYKDDLDLSCAYSIYKFTHSVSASVTFFYSSFDLTLDYHIVILNVFAIIAIYTFYSIEKLVRKDVSV